MWFDITVRLTPESAAASPEVSPKARTTAATKAKRNPAPEPPLSNAQPATDDEETEPFDAELGVPHVGEGEGPYMLVDRWTIAVI